MTLYLVGENNQGIFFFFNLFSNPCSILLFIFFRWHNYNKVPKTVYGTENGFNKCHPLPPLFLYHPISLGFALLLGKLGVVPRSFGWGLHFSLHWWISISLRPLSVEIQAEFFFSKFKPREIECHRVKLSVQGSIFLKSESSQELMSVREILGKAIEQSSLNWGDIF